MTAVPRLWPGETFAILAGGPSLTLADVDACRAAGCRTIAIKDAIRLAPWTEAWYGCDAKYWRHYGDSVPEFTGLRYTLEADAAQWATVLRNTGQTGLETDSSGLRTGKNSGFQAVNLAVHLGARRILLLGYDMQQVDGRNYWFAEPRPASYSWVQPPYRDFRECFETIVEPLRAEGITVINCTPDSALTCFTMMSLAQALEPVPA